MADVRTYLDSVGPLVHASQSLRRGRMTAADAEDGIPIKQRKQWFKDPDAEEFRRDPWGPLKPLDLLNRLQYPIANTLRRLTDPVNSYSFGNYAKGIANGFFGNERSQTTDTLTNLGWRPYTKKGKLAKAAVGLAGDILTDPLTWFTAGTLTAAGKAAKAGKLIKVADKLYDLGKLSDMNKVRGILEGGMKAAGVADDVIKTTLDGYKGVKSAKLAENIVKDLTKFGQAAEKIELASNWSKQFKTGQRALLQARVPIWGKSATVPNPLNVFKDAKGRNVGDKLSQRLFNTATYLGNRFSAGRAKMNGTLWGALPEATKEIQQAAKQGNLFKLGEKYYNLASRKDIDTVKKFLRNEIEAKGISSKGMLEGWLADVPPGARNLADEAVQVFRNLGVDFGEKAYLKGLLNREIAARFASRGIRIPFTDKQVARGIWKPIGKVANTLVDAFNILPEGSKAIRRFARGTSQRMGDVAGQDLERVLGKNAEAILDAGLPKPGYVEIVDDTGKVLRQAKESKAQKIVNRYIKNGTNAQIKRNYGKVIVDGEEYILSADDVRAMRYEFVEAASHPAVMTELRKIGRRLAIKGEELGPEHYKQALEVLRASKNENTLYGKYLRRKMANTPEGWAKPMLGLSDQKIDRMLATVDSWDNIDDAMRAVEASYNAAQANRKMGRISNSTYWNFLLGNQINPIQRNLNLSDVEKLVKSGSGAKGYADDLARKASRNQTMFEARLGVVDADDAMWLRENLDNIVTTDINGRPIYGRDIINPNIIPFVRDQKRLLDDWAKSIGKYDRLTAYEKTLLEKAEAQKMLPRQMAEKATRKFDKQIANANKRVEYWREQLKGAYVKQDEYNALSQEAASKVETIREEAMRLEEEIKKLGNRKSPVLNAQYKKAVAAYNEARENVAKIKRAIKNNESLINSLNQKYDDTLAEIARIETASEITSESERKLFELKNNLKEIDKKIDDAYLRGKGIPRALLNRRRKTLARMQQISPDFVAGGVRNDYGRLGTLMEDAGADAERYLGAKSDKIADLKYDVKHLESQMEMPTKHGEEQIERAYRGIGRAEEEAARSAGRAAAADERLTFYNGRFNAAERAKENILARRAAADNVAYARGQHIVDMLYERADRIHNLARERKLSADALLMQLNDIHDDITRISQLANKRNFSLDLFKNLGLSLKGSENAANVRMTLQGIAEGFPDIPANGIVPPNFVRAEDIIPKVVLNATETSGEVLGEYRKIAEMLGGPELVAAVRNKMIPFEAVPAIDAMLRPHAKSSNILFNVIDRVHKILKPFMLSAPGTQTRNTVSSFMMAWANGDFHRPQDFINFGRSVAWNFGKWNDYPEWEKEWRKVIDGKEYSFAELFEEFANRGGVDSNRAIDDFLLNADKSIGRKASKAGEMFTKTFTGLQSKFAGKTETSFRFAHFLNELDKGATFDEAMSSVARTFYDYSDLSHFEKEWMRRLFPFYTFFRKNAEANLRYLTQNPVYLSSPVKFVKNFNTITEDEKGAIPMSWLNNSQNQWLANQASFRLALPWDSKGDRLFPLQNFLPQVDAGIVASPRELKQTVSGMITPIIKTPLEIIENRDTFMDRPIKTDAYPTRYYLGMEMNPYVAHAIRPLRIFDVADRVYRELNPKDAERHGMKARNESKSLAERGLRATGAFFGTKSYEQDRLSVANNMIKALMKDNADIGFRLKRYPKMLPERRRALLDKRRENLKLIQAIRRGQEI